MMTTDLRSSEPDRLPCDDMFSGTRHGTCALKRASTYVALLNPDEWVIDWLADNTPDEYPDWQDGQWA